MRDGSAPDAGGRQRRGGDALGLVHRPAGTASADRSWARALVVRHAHDARLRLVDVLELDDDAARNRDVLGRLAHLAAVTPAGVLVTDGLPDGVGERLAADLGLRHEHVRRVQRSA